MKYGETDQVGSFKAQGIGLSYAFSAVTNSLCIARAGRTSPLLEYEFDRLLSKNPHLYVMLVEKATQIQALKYSANATINLVGTLDDLKLPGILTSSCRLASYALALQKERHGRFRRMFIEDQGLKDIALEIQSGNGTVDRFYVITAETRRGNKVATRSSSLHGSLSFLAEKLARDVIAREFGYRLDEWPQTVMQASHTLSLLALLLNDRFDPARKVGGSGIPTLSAALGIQKPNSAQ